MSIQLEFFWEGAETCFITLVSANSCMFRSIISYIFNFRKHKKVETVFRQDLIKMWDKHGLPRAFSKHEADVKK